MTRPEPITRRDLAERVVGTVRSEPGSTLNAVVASVGRRRRDVLRALEALRLSGLLRVERGRRGARHWFAAPDAAERFPRGEETRS